MVQIRNLEKQYKSFKVLKGLNMTIKKGDVYGFLGKNGCGKSTTMNILSNIIPKDSGEIVFGKEDLTIGYLPESPMIYGYMNSYEYLEYIAACCSYKGDIKARVKEVLEIVGMIEGGKRRVKGYSRGMNQRLGIAATIFSNPDLIILDEPTSALDPQGRAEVMNIIKRLSSTGATILLCTHILTDVERVANKIGIMRDGVMVIEDEIESIASKYSSHKIEFQLFNTNPDSFDRIKEFGGEGFSFDGSIGLFTIDAPNPEEDSQRLLSFLSSNSLVPKKLQYTRATLEDVYIKVVGENAN